MRAALYIRVSDEEQVKEGYSIESQTAVCKRWVADKGFDLVDVYVDEGVSSKTLKRPDMQRMIRDVERSKFDLLVFWRLNRLTRTVKDKVYLFDLFEKQGVSLKSMTEEIDTTTASGRMITNLLVSVAQGEREQTAENVFGTMMERHAAGHRQGAVAPYGYYLEDSKLVVNEEQANVVKRIFEMYATKQYGIREIAIIINEDPDSPKDKLWNYTAVRYVLMNPTYCGRLRWNYRKASGKPTGKEVISIGLHEALVDDALFDRINTEILERKTGGKIATSEYAFAGTLRCGRCGRAMTGFSAKKTNGRHRYYRCSGRANYGNCNMPIVHDDRLNVAFLEALDYDPNKMKQFINKNVDQTTDIRKKQITRLKKELEQLQVRKKKWQIAYANDAITLEDLKLHTQEDKLREDEIQTELKSIPDSEVPQQSKEQLLEQFNLIRDHWKKSDNEKIKKVFIRDVFESITINTDVEKGQGAPGKFIEVVVTDVRLRI